MAYGSSIFDFLSPLLSGCLMLEHAGIWVHLYFHNPTEIIVCAKPLNAALRNSHRL